jgi:penicillin V acylase-like amidase (Ntn superfamily)
MCTRVFWNDNGVAMVVARTLDWETSDEPRLWVLPRGTARNGGVGEGSAEWASRFGSVTMQGWGCVTSEGLNEAGLSARVLYLEATEWEGPDDRLGVSNLVWTQYVVDNDPPYDEQVAGLARYRPWGGDLGIPGDIASEERFVRATYYRSHLPKPADDAEAVAGVMGVIRNCQVPYGAPDTRFDTFPTWWASVTDLTERVYYFQSTRAPNVVWLELDKLDFAEGAPTLTLDPRDPVLTGPIDAALAPTELDWGV